MGGRGPSRHPVSLAVADAAGDGLNGADPRHFRKARRCLPTARRRIVRVPFTARAPARGGRRPGVGYAGAHHSDVDASVRAVHGSSSQIPCARLPPGRRSSNAPAILRWPAGAELTDAFNGIAAANQLALLATRVSVLVRGVNQDPQETAVVAVRPIKGRCGLGLPADRSRQAGGVELPGAEIQPRAALDGAADGRRSDQAARPCLAPPGVAVDCAPLERATS
jgi:hypothetical protein